MMITSLFTKENLWRLLSLALFLLLWQLAAMALGKAILLPPPIMVFQYFLHLLSTSVFYQHLLSTFIRGLGGFLLAFFWGLTLGILSSLFKPLKMLIQPFLVLFRSVPLLALILLAVIWFKQSQVPYFVVFLIVFPLISANVTQGIKSEDSQILEMAGSFKLSFWDRILHITIPHLTPFLLSGISTGLGIAWKAVVAAEILTMPSYAIGTAMQRAQLELDSRALFSWTLTIIILSSICDGLIHLVEKRLLRYKARVQ